MEILSELPDARDSAGEPCAPRRGAVTFGNFDGVHLGHRALLAAVAAAAQRSRGPATVVTFDPHPLRLLRPERAPRAVDTLEGRLQRLAEVGVDRVVVLRFDHALAARSAEWFAQQLLGDGLGAAEIVIGPDTRFGHGGVGDLQLLQRLAAPRGVAVRPCGALQWAGAPVSSSRVRHEVAAGRVDEAAALLGRPWSLHGEVVRGDQRGRTIGYPTANLEAAEQIQPAPGVYAARALLADGRVFDAVTHCGVRPTFGHDAWRVEAHLFGFAEDLYGQRLRLEFHHRLRGEQRFASAAELIAQIGVDAAAARAVLAGAPR